MVTVRLRSHWCSVMVLPVGDWLTVRSRAPLMEVSVEETKFPPTVMLFFICRSWAWADRVMDSSAIIQERRRNVRVGIVPAPWLRRRDYALCRHQRPTARFRELDRKSTRLNSSHRT